MRPRASPQALIAPALLLALTVACDLPTGLPRVESTFLFPVDSVVVPVTGVSASASARQDLSGIDLTERVVRATVRVSPSNPAGARGQLTVRISGGGVTVTRTIDVAGGPEQRISLDRQQTQALLGGVVDITASGTLCRASGCGVQPPPIPNVTLRNELELVVELGGEG